MREEPTKLPNTVRFAGFSCDVYRTAYPAGGATALFLTDQDDGEPVATATVNVEGVSELLPSGAVLIRSTARTKGCSTPSWRPES